MNSVIIITCLSVWIAIVLFFWIGAYRPRPKAPLTPPQQLRPGVLGQRSQFSDKGLTFKCPNCEYDQLSEVSRGVTAVTRIREIQPNGDYEYAFEPENRGGILEHYQCSACGWIILPNTPKRLANWLQAQ